MLEAIEFFLMLAQKKLQNYKGRKAMKAIEDLLDIQCRIRDLPPPVIQRYQRPEQLYLWQKEKV